jgi:hypothetical protein
MRLAAVPQRRNVAVLALASAVLVGALQILFADLVQRSVEQRSSIDAGVKAGKRP